MTDTCSANVKTASAGLLGLTGRDDVLRFLDDAGYSLTGTAEELVGSAGDAGILVVGSVAEGYQTAASDLDILFLTYGDPDDAPPAGVRIEAGASSEILTYTGGVEVNSEVIFHRNYAQLATTMQEMMGALATGQELQRLPMFDMYTLRFLHRLRTGIVLSGDDVITRFREDFQVDALPLYLSVLNVVTARERLEDARTSSTEVVGLVEFACAEIIEACIMTLAAAGGFTSQTRRSVMNWIAELPEDFQLAATLHAMRSALFDCGIRPPEHKAALVDECATHVERTFEVLRSDPVAAKVLDDIFSMISYAD